MSGEKILTTDWMEAKLGEGLFLCSITVPGVDEKIYGLLRQDNVGVRKKTTLEIMLESNRENLNYLARNNQSVLSRDYQEALKRLGLKEGQELPPFLCVHMVNICPGTDITSIESINLFQHLSTETSMDTVEASSSLLGRILPGWEISPVNAGVLQVSQK